METMDVVLTSGEMPSPPILINALAMISEGMSRSTLKKAISQGKVSIDGEVVTKVTAEVKPGMRLELKPETRRPRRAGPEAPHMYHRDNAIIVALKEPGILTLSLRENKDSLEERLRRAVARLEGKGRKLPTLRGVHRLDKPASGIVVITRTVDAQRILQSQFRAHTIHRSYLARVMGTVPWDRKTIVSRLVKDRGDGLKGTAPYGRQGGKEATTHIEVLHRGEKTSLLRCRLETGRTHQIRIHCAEAGHPIVGEAVYIRDHKGPWVKDNRLLLHATELGFYHPVTEEMLRFIELPTWLSGAETPVAKSAYGEE